MGLRITGVVLLHHRAVTAEQVAHVRGLAHAPHWRMDRIDVSLLQDPGVSSEGRAHSDAVA